MTGQSDRIPPTDRRYPQRVYQCPGCWSLGWHRDPEDGDIECDCGERMTRIDLRGAAAPPEPPRLLDFVSAYFDTVDGDGRPAAVYRAEQDMRKEWERIVSAPVAASPPEPPLDVERWQRLVRGLEAIRDTSTDSASRQLADSMLAMLDGGAAPDRLPSDPGEPESGG